MYYVYIKERCVSNISTFDFIGYQFKHQGQDQGMPLCLQSLLDLLKNPNFNRFQHNKLLFNDVLMSRFQDFQIKSDLYLLPPIENIYVTKPPFGANDFDGTAVDIDAVYQVIHILQDFYQRKGRKLHVVFDKKFRLLNEWSEEILLEKLGLNVVPKGVMEKEIENRRDLVVLSSYQTDYPEIKHSVIRIADTDTPRYEFQNHERIVPVRQQDMLTMKSFEKILQQIQAQERLNHHSMQPFTEKGEPSPRDEDLSTG